MPSSFFLLPSPTLAISSHTYTHTHTQFFILNTQICLFCTISISQFGVVTFQLLNKQHIASGNHYKQRSSKTLLVSCGVFSLKFTQRETNSDHAEAQNLHTLRHAQLLQVFILTVFPSGLIAVSVAVRLSFEERVHFSGKLLLQPSLILFWSFSDPIHPQVIRGQRPHSLKIPNVTFTCLF